MFRMIYFLVMALAVLSVALAQYPSGSGGGKGATGAAGATGATGAAGPSVNGSVYPYYTPIVPSEWTTSPLNDNALLVRTDDAGKGIISIKSPGANIGGSGNGQAVCRAIPSSPYKVYVTATVAAGHTGASDSDILFGIMALDSVSKKFAMVYFGSEAIQMKSGACLGNSWPSVCTTSWANGGFEARINSRGSGIPLGLVLADDGTNWIWSYYDGVSETWPRGATGETQVKTFTPNQLCLFSFAYNGDYGMTFRYLGYGSLL